MELIDTFNQPLFQHLLTASLTFGLTYLLFNSKSNLPSTTIHPNSKSVVTKIRNLGKSDEKVNEDLFDEQLSRNISFLGQDGMQKLKSSHVVVVGVGGVGSWAAYMLLKSGCLNITLIDFDLVTLSSLNRHVTATRNDVGRSKVECLKEAMLKVLPEANIKIEKRVFKKENAAELLTGDIDYVLDCIDNLDTKVDLLEYCYKNNIKVLASMGAGAKSDPSKIQIADISETFEDALARSVRRLLKLRGISRGIPVVYSTEKPGPVKLLPLDESQEADADEFAILPDFRARILPVLGTLPAIFGMTLATYTVCKLAEHPIAPLAIKGREGLYKNMLRELVVREQRHFDATGIPPFDKADVEYLVEEIWASRSAISKDLDKPTLVRWWPQQPLGFQNCAVVTRKEANIHEKLKTDEEVVKLYGKDVIDYVNLRFQAELVFSKWRLL